MVDDIDDTCKIFAHVCFNIIFFCEELRKTIVQVCGDDSVNPTLLIIFIKFGKSLCEKTISSTDKYSFGFSLLDLFGNIQHTFSGCDHVINDNNIFALYGITEEFVSNDRVFAVDNSGVVAAFVEHTHIYAKNIGKVYGS